MTSHLAFQSPRPVSALSVAVLAPTVGMDAVVSAEAVGTLAADDVRADRS
jgi:hypothetical protein